MKFGFKLSFPPYYHRFCVRERLKAVIVVICNHHGLHHFLFVHLIHFWTIIQQHVDSFRNSV